MRSLLCLSLLLLTPLASGGLAYELHSAYLELRQTGFNTYQVLWKVPAHGEAPRLALYIRLSTSCRDTTPRRIFSHVVHIERWRM